MALLMGVYQVGTAMETHQKPKGFGTLDVPRIALLRDGVRHVDITFVVRTRCGLLSFSTLKYQRQDLFHHTAGTRAPVTFAELRAGKTLAWPHLEGIIRRAVCRLLPHRGRAVILHREPPPEENQTGEEIYYTQTSQGYKCPVEGDLPERVFF